MLSIVEFINPFSFLVGKLQLNKFFSSEISKRGLQLNDPLLSQFVNTIDTLGYNKIPYTKSEKKKNKIKEKGKVLNLEVVELGPRAVRISEEI